MWFYLFGKDNLFFQRQELSWYLEGYGIILPHLVGMYSHNRVGTQCRLILDKKEIKER